MVPLWVLSIIQHLVFRGPKRDPNFDNHPCIVRVQVLFFAGGNRSAGAGGGVLTGVSQQSKVLQGSQYSLVPYIHNRR